MCGVAKELEDASGLESAGEPLNIQVAMLELRSACEKLHSLYGVLDKNKTSVFLGKLALVVGIYQQMVQHAIYPRLQVQNYVVKLFGNTDATKVRNYLNKGCEKLKRND